MATKTAYSPSSPIPSPRLHQMLAISAIVEGLDIPGDILQRGSLMADHLDPGIKRLFQDRLQRLGEFGTTVIASTPRAIRSSII